MQEAFDQGYTRMQLVNANGMLSVNVGLVYRQAVGAAPAYDYDLNISPVAAQDLICDVSGVSGNPSGPCHVTLWIQIPTFERQLSPLTPLMR